MLCGKVAAKQNSFSFLFSNATQADPLSACRLDDFAEKVVPELQRRGIFRRQYEGSTLRENLGLKRPLNRFFEEAVVRKAG